MLTFAIVFLSFNIFRLTQNRSCFGYVFKNVIYWLREKKSMFQFLIHYKKKNILELMDGSAVMGICEIKQLDNVKVSNLNTF